MRERPSDRWISIALSVLVHATIVGLLVWGFLSWKKAEPQAQQLAIEATVVDARNLPAEVLVTPASPEAQVQPAPAEPPPPEPPPPEPPPPEPTPKADEAERQQQRQREAEQQRAEQERAERLAEDKRAEDRRAAEKRQEEKEAQEKATQAAEERKRREEAERVAREKTEQEAKRRAAEQRLREQSEAELRAQLAAEERLNAVRTSGMQNQYLAMIQNHIQRNWNRPASARPGVVCEVQVTQVPGGQVVGVRIGACNGDAAVKQSIEDAVYRSSPLPPPPDAALFDRSLSLTFRPDE